MDVVIERLSADDWPTLRTMRLASLSDAPAAFWATLADESGFDEPRWTSFLRAAAWFVAVHESERVGIAGALRRPEAPDEPELIGMWVAPTARGNGVGTALLDALCASAAVEGAHAVALWVVDGNDDAYRVYARHGFQETGERAPLPHDPSRIEIRMRKTLRADPPVTTR